MKRLSRVCGPVCSLVLVCLSGCQGARTDTSAETLFDHACEDPRPTMCTREYRPVCALRDTGVRCVTTPCPSTEWHSYGNACGACSDAEVFGYKPGACPEPDADR